MLYVGYVLGKRRDVNAVIDSVVTSDLIRMCVFGSALYHCHSWGEILCLGIRPDYVMCAHFLLWTLLFSFQDKSVSICY